MKKGMQMALGSNDQASVTEESTSSRNIGDNETSDQSNNSENGRRIHWSVVQRQRFQACVHIQHCQDISNTNDVTQPKSALNERVNNVVADEACKLKETLNKDMASIVSLDTGSTFNSTNNENVLTDTVKTKQPVASRTNVGKQLNGKP